MMPESTTRKPSLKGLGSIRRRSVTVSRDSLVEIEPLEGSTHGLPVVVRAAVEGLDLKSWAADRRDLIAEKLRTHGGVLFRGFKRAGERDLEELIRLLAGQPLEYSYRSTPRTQVSGRIYTSTEYPADQSIPMHNEMSYSRRWPMKIWFLCVHAAEEGGETPIADSRRVYERIDPAVRRRFDARGVMYVRNYGEGLDLPWQNVFQTDDPSAVEKFCRDAGIDYEWLDGGDRLRTRQVCQGLAVHPATGEPIWFNQAHLFHVSSLPEEMRHLLLETLGEAGLPRQALYGDGQPIELPVLEEIRGAYEQESVSFRWREGDLMMLDNMLVAHGRRPFKGRRKIVVGMAEAHSAES